MEKSKLTEEQLIAIKNQVEKESVLYDYLTRDYPFEVIQTKYGEEEDDNATLYVPSYQRNLVWNVKNKSYFIESVFLGAPLTPFLVSEDKKGRLEIIDGSQRIRTLLSFYNNEFKLKSLETLSTLNDRKFKDLPLNIKKEFINRDFKIIVVNEAQSKIKEDIFKRINTSGKSLTGSEIRKGSYSGPFYDLALELKNDTDFRSICPISSTRINRGEYEELILRFFAYKDKYQEATSNVGIFLDNYLSNMNKTDFNKEVYINTFKQMVEFIKQNFDLGFKKQPNNQSIPRVRFEAISVGVHLALQETPDLSNPNMEWLNSAGFKIHTTSDTSNGTNRLKNRIEFVRDGLLGRLNNERLANG